MSVGKGTPRARPPGLAKRRTPPAGVGATKGVRVRHGQWRALNTALVGLQALQPGDLAGPRPVSSQPGTSMSRPGLTHGPPRWPPRGRGRVVAPGPGSRAGPHAAPWERATRVGQTGAAPRVTWSKPPAAVNGQVEVPGGGHQ